MNLGATLDGELNFARVPALYAQAEALSQASPLDLSRVTRADSAGLALLLELSRRAKARGIELKLIGAPRQVTALAGFFGLGAVLRFEA